MVQAPKNPRSHPVIDPVSPWCPSHFQGLLPHEPWNTTAGRTGELQLWLVVKKPSWRIWMSMGRMTSHNMTWKIKNVPKQQPAFLFSWQVLFRKLRPTKNHRMYHMSQFGLNSIKFLRQLGKLNCFLPTPSKSNQQTSQQLHPIGPTFGRH